MRLWEAAGPDPSRRSRAKERQTRRDQNRPLEVLEKERQKGDPETMCGASFVATWGGGQATQGRKSDSEVGLIANWKESPGLS